MKSDPSTPSPLSHTLTKSSSTSPATTSSPLASDKPSPSSVLAEIPGPSSIPVQSPGAIATDVLSEHHLSSPENPTSYTEDDFGMLSPQNLESNHNSSTPSIVVQTTTQQPPVPSPLPRPLATPSPIPSSPSLVHTVVNSDTRSQPHSHAVTDTPPKLDSPQPAAPIEERKDGFVAVKRRSETDDNLPRKRRRGAISANSDSTNVTTAIRTAAAASATSTTLSTASLLSASDAPSAIIAPSAAPFSILPPPTMPAKLLPVLQMFHTIQHEKWSALISTWMCFEVAHSFQGKLAATGRPACVGDWISRARNPKWRPVPSKSLPKEVEKWWAELQPDFRIADNGQLLLDMQGEVGSPDDWVHLQQAGINGVVSIVAALFFWHCSLPVYAQGRLPAYRQKAAMEQAEESWIRTVIDVTRVFEHLNSLLKDA
jgi:hypothetical protein